MSWLWLFAHLAVHFISLSNSFYLYSNSGLSISLNHIHWNGMFHSNNQNTGKDEASYKRNKERVLVYEGNTQ